MAGRERGGFAAMNREKQREIARRGGRAAHQKGTAHEFTPEEARTAGRKGGMSVSQNREHMSRIGRAGGLSSRSGRRTNTGSQQPKQPAGGGEHERGSEAQATP